MDLLVLADSDGVVDMTPSAISARTRIPLDLVAEFLFKLELPDPESRTPDEDGRRIRKLDDHRNWGWLIVNYKQFRGIATEEQRRTKTRERVSRFRLKANGLEECNAPVTLCNAPVTPPYAYACTSSSSSLTPEEGSAEGRNQRLHGIPSSVKEVIDFGKTLNPSVPEEICRKFWSYYEGQARTNASGQIFWITSGNTVVTNWKAKLPSFGGVESKSKQKQPPTAKELQTSWGQKPKK